MIRFHLWIEKDPQNNGLSTGPIYHHAEHCPRTGDTIRVPWSTKDSFRCVRVTEVIWCWDEGGSTKHDYDRVNLRTELIP